MSEAELHVIKARLRGGILNKVRRGEYRCALPTGLIYDQSGNVTLDPDTQVRETIAHFFDTFSRVGAHSRDGDQVFQAIVITDSSDRDQARRRTRLTGLSVLEMASS